MPEDELIKRIKSWLGEQGYPLEMRVERDLRAAGFTTVQGDYFPDPQTQEPREIDVVGSAWVDSDDFVVAMDVVVECKTSQKNPFVLFVSKDEAFVKHSLLYEATNDYARVLIRRARHHRDAPDLAALACTNRRGYGLVEARKEQTDRGFRALMSAAKAALARKTALDGTQDASYPVLTLFIPVVVLGTPLYQCYLGDDGDLAVEPISRGDLLWRHPLPGRSGSLIRIVRDDAFADFAKGLRQALSFLNTIALERREHIDAAIKQVNERNAAGAQPAR